MTDKPWLSEPEFKGWTSAAGLDCRIIRNASLLHLCGYVALPEGHPWFGEHYDHIDADAHGGLTFSGHRLRHGDNDALWWIGFDCAHAGDLVPGIPAFPDGVYRTFEYVEAECERLAAQAAEA